MGNWNGGRAVIRITEDMSTPELCRLIGRKRHTIHADVKANLLPAPTRRPGVKAKFFTAKAVRAYLKYKFPELIRANPTPPQTPSHDAKN